MIIKIINFIIIINITTVIIIEIADIMKNVIIVIIINDNLYNCYYYLQFKDLVENKHLLFVFNNVDATLFIK